MGASHYQTVTPCFPKFLTEVQCVCLDGNITYGQPIERKRS